MAFNTLSFLVFFGVVLGLYQLPRSWRARKLVLLGASYGFYAAWNPPFVALLAFSTAVDWWAARGIASGETVRRRRGFLLVSLTANLGLLSFFKYGGFLVENFTQLMATLGIAYRPAEPDIVLPLGISFYTFQTLSYTIDVYRGRFQPWPSRLDYALYVSFFPQLVAGPIVRAGTCLPQCVEARRADAWQLTWGLSFFTLGLFQKIVLADGVFSPFAEAVFDAPADPSPLFAWLGSAAFAGQVYCDFAGYSACAIGAAACLGFAIPKNFHSPYAAVGFRDFWRRWHISLSTWLRDYVYVSLGGNRRSLGPELGNLMITLLVSGLWHGAAWHFVLFGGIHGALLCVERGLGLFFAGGRVWRRPEVRAALGVLTFALWCLTMPFFRAEASRAFEILTAMLGSGGRAVLLPPTAGAFDLLALAVCLLSLIAGQWALREASLEEVLRRCPWPLYAALLALLWLAILLMPGTDRAFIYFLF
jgi:D-alanyl-lipoteichoic acid acyltransferase DltB (MBOAT superfamily)